MLSYEAARAKVIEVICARHCAPPPPPKPSNLRMTHRACSAASWRKMCAPTAIIRRLIARRAMDLRCGPRDAAQAGAKLRLIGESRAGVPFDGMVEPGTCVQIMTGAPVPRGANAIVMNEYARVKASMWFSRSGARGRAFRAGGAGNARGRKRARRAARGSAMPNWRWPRKWGVRS